MKKLKKKLLKGVDVCPKFVEFYVTLGHSYISKFNLSKCIKIYKKGLKKDNKQSSYIK